MRIKTPKGFSTVELMIAFALMALVFGGVILADYGSAYWAVAAETSNEGLYKAKTRIEEMRAVVKKDFRLASSSPFTRVSDTSCNGGGLCYYVTTLVSDLSPCSKYVEAKVDWQVQNYPTTTTSLFTNLTDAAEAVSLGGGCTLTLPAGTWNGMTQSSSASGGGSAPSAIDVLGGVSYITYSPAVPTPPYFSIANAGNFISFNNSFAAMDPLNAIDVARDLSTGRTYGYAAIASTSLQLEVLDLTDVNNPSSIAKLQLNSVDKAGSYPQGFRIAYYGGKVYITVRETQGPEFHVIEVSNPASPVELGNRELNTSVYGMVVRDVKLGTAVHRLAFLATSGSQGLTVLDVTNPASIPAPLNASTIVSFNPARSVFLSGNTMYVGTVSNTSGPELYLLDASNIFNATAGGLPILSSVEIGSDVVSIRVSDPYVFVGTSGGQVRVFKKTGNTLTSLSQISAGALGGLDLENDSIYAASGNMLRVLQSQ